MLKSHSSDMFRGSTMVPFLLLLLALESQAENVCFNISGGVINITLTNSSINETRSGNVNCVSDGQCCTFQCPTNMTFNVSSSCFELNVTFYPAEVVNNTVQFRYCTLYLCKHKTILHLIRSMDKNNSYQMEMMQFFYVRHSCAELFSSNETIKKTAISVEKHIILNIMRISQLEPGGSITYDLKDLSLHVVNVSEVNLTGSSSRMQIEAPQLLPQNTTFVPHIWLPVHALRTIRQEERIIGLVSYMSHSHFQFKQDDISSMVIRIQLLGGQRLRNLTTSIKMIFKTTPSTVINNASWLQCHYFDDSDWRWKTDGCESYGIIQNETSITCNCDHATPFAVLLMREPIAEVHWEILSYISYIGCGLSAFFTSLSIVIYLFSRNHRTDYSMSIHVSLSGALFLLNSTFLMSEWGATVKPGWVCVFVAALMHYSLLCSFTWMAIEALHLYLLLIKVFNTYYKHYMLKLSLVGWGIPCAIMAVSLGVTDLKQFYGLKQVTLADTNHTNAICWITDDSFIYLNLVYFTLIFVFNTGILMAVASGIFKMKQVSKPGAGSERKTRRDPVRFSESCRSSLTVLGLTWLLGTTWGLVFLGSGYVNYPILYLFCILNSIQGFFMFLWICLSAQKQRKRDMNDRMTSTPVKTSGISSGSTTLSAISLDDKAQK